MNKYQYCPLETGHIRLVTLLPGEYRETIRIFIDTAELLPISNTRKGFPPRMNAESLQPTLPTDWSAWDTLDDEILFYYEQTNGTAWDASWDHPGLSVDPSLYRKPAFPSRANNETVYEALSYTWRSSEPDEDAVVEIESDNILRLSSLRLGGNLACAMRHLRYSQRPRKLWIDAVCIDQSNLEERGEQVARMSSIYQHASRVIVWLGNGSEESDLAMCKLAYLGRQVILTKNNWLLCPSGAEEPYWCESACEVPYSEETWSVIRNLLERPWFSRIWVIQEIQLAAHGAMIQCGREKMPWSHFRSAITCLWNKKALPRPLSRGRIKFIKHLAWTYYEQNAVSEILHLINGRECFDERDYVYGVLGLLPPEFQRAIIPSYKLTAAEVYLNLTILYLKEQKDLNILRDCQSGASNTRHGLPSWVPDLSSTKQWTQPMQWQNAAGNSTAVFHFMGSHGLENWKTEFANPQYLHKLIEHDPQDESLPFHDQWVFDLIQKRIFFKTCKGSIGLGPQGLQKGDIIVVLLGCDSPLILRPAPNMRYVLIGESYLDELKDAAALLGPLLPNWQVQVYTESIDRRGIFRFLDKDTGIIQDEDPRMSGSTRNLAMSEEYGGNGKVGSYSTEGLTSSRSDVSPHQGPDTEVLRSPNSSLQKFVLC